MSDRSLIQANELYNSFLPLVVGGNLNETYHTKAKQCALIAVDLMIKEYSVLQIETNFCFKMWLYWQDVKQDLENL